MCGGEDEALGGGGEGEEPLEGAGQVAGDLNGEDGERGDDGDEVAETGEGLEPGVLVGGAEEDEEDDVEDEDKELAGGDEAAGARDEGGGEAKDEEWAVGKEAEARIEEVGPCEGWGGPVKASISVGCGAGGWHVMLRRENGGAECPVLVDG